MTEFKTLDYSRAVNYDCILLNFPAKTNLKKYAGAVNAFLKNMKILRYYMIVAALVDENNDNDTLKGNINYY